ncbi:uncharacterized protein TEOVI_000459700 [Trypanosoma equiperdum]|uniref:Uncharacterized protein n=2 Tax=Trypanozoon TaxID=39700 RepID=A0A1G4IKB9_TRYEQ|nr:hypothetical protein DPX39_110031200 [Trypanosoma brucei equiperdum]SCU73013.1 hypothetical protein, conserved [Trypanosoma equiperdum]
MAVPRWMRRFEIYAVCMIWPISTIVGIVGTYKLFMWSYGGRDCFRYVVIEEPMKGQWFQANPKSALGMDTPLANVPKFLETSPYTYDDNTGSD